MEGIVLQNIDREKFFELLNKVNKIGHDLDHLLDKHRSEKISPETAAEEVDVTTQTIYLWIKKGIVPASKIGRKLFIKRDDLENALKEVKSIKYKR